MSGKHRSLKSRGISPELIRQAYQAEGSIRAVAKALDISPVTVGKYTKGMPKPEKTVVARPSIEPLADPQWLHALHQAMKESFLEKRVWIDHRGRKIPMRAVKEFVIQLPDTPQEVVPVYAQLRDGSRTVLLYLTPLRLMGPTSWQPSPHTSDPPQEDEDPEDLD